MSEIKHIWFHSEWWLKWISFSV